MMNSSVDFSFLKFVKPCVVIGNRLLFLELPKDFSGKTGIFKRTFEISIVLGEVLAEQSVSYTAGLDML